MTDRGCALSRDTLAGNTDTGLLKIIAFVTMFIDHIGAARIVGYPELRVIGRIAMPIYAWCLVVGCVKTRDPLRYLLRMLVLAVISQPINMLALSHTWSELNILFLLVLGILAIQGIRQKFLLSQIWAPALCFLATGFLDVNYGWRGLAFILIIYLARNSLGGLAAACIAYFLFWGTQSSSVSGMFGVQFGFLAWPGIGDALKPLFNLQAMAWLALPFILIKTHTGIKLNKWVGYALYPAHLLIIAVLRLTVKEIPFEALTMVLGMW